MNNTADDKMGRPPCACSCDLAIDFNAARDQQQAELLVCINVSFIAMFFCLSVSRFARAEQTGVVLVSESNQTRVGEELKKC